MKFASLLFLLFAPAHSFAETCGGSLFTEELPLNDESCSQVSDSESCCIVRGAPIFASSCGIVIYGKLPARYARRAGLCKEAGNQTFCCSKSIEEAPASSSPSEPSNPSDPSDPEPRTCVTSTACAGIQMGFGVVDPHNCTPHLVCSAE